MKVTKKLLKPVPHKLGTKAAAGPRPDVVPEVAAKKLAAQAKKLAKQAKVVAAADAVPVKRGKLTSIFENRCAECGVVFKTSNPDAKECSKCATKAARKKRADDDAPRVDCRLLIGDLSLPVDASSLEHTLGSGRWGGGRGLVDSWPDAAWVGLLVHLGLAADPLDRTAADQPVKRLVQRLWYEAVNPTVLERLKPVFDKRDEERAEEYKEKFTKVKAVSAEKSVRAKTSFGRHGETKYTPTAALKDKKLVLGGQAAILLEAFKKADWVAMTTAEATKGMLTAGLKTTTKPERIAAFYLCQWVKKSLLERTTE